MAIPGDPPTGVGALAARGASYLALRECLGAIVRLGGTVLVIRVIGPSSYGIYAGAAAFVLFVALSAQMGAEVYLIRQREEPTPHMYASVLAALVCSSFLFAGAGVAATYVLAPWLHPAGVLYPLRLLLAGVPINVCWAPFQAKIERGFGYRRIGLLELAGDVVLYATAIPLALAHLGPWSLVAGYFAWQTFLLVGSIVLSGLPPRLAWSPETMRSLARHGVGYAATSWVVSLAALANPLVIGRYSGAAGVGYVSFAQRLVQTVGFAARSAYRLGIVALSKIRSDETSRLSGAVERGSLLQLIALALPLGLFALFARSVVPAVFGAAWARAVPLFAMLALASVLNASGMIQSSVLLSRGQNLRVVGGAVIQSVVFVVVLLVAVPVIGINAYGVATVAGLADLAFIDAMARREVPFGYRSMLPVGLAIIPPVLAPLLPLYYGPVTLLPALVVLGVPHWRHQLIDAGRLTWSLVRKPAS